MSMVRLGVIALAGVAALVGIRRVKQSRGGSGESREQAWDPISDLPDHDTGGAGGNGRRDRQTVSAAHGKAGDS